MAKFVVYFNGEPLKTYELDEPVVSIGRLPENTISIANMGVSRRHSKIEEDVDRKYILSDLNSLNGTYVNGKRIKKIALNDGDKIAIGKYTILYEEGNAKDGTNSSSSFTPSSFLEPGMSPQPEAQVDDAVSNKFVEENIDLNSKTPAGVEVLSKDQNEKEGNVPVFIEINKHVVYKLDKTYLTIGNGDEDDIFITGFMIGPSQVSIEKRDDGIHIIANKLIGKIKINGKSCREHQLQHKDRIEIGSSTFRFMENG